MTGIKVIAVLLALGLIGNIATEAMSDPDLREELKEEIRKIQEL